MQTLIMSDRPVAYENLSPDSAVSKTAYKGIGFGYGKRSDFTFQPQQVENPGPAHY